MADLGFVSWPHGLTPNKLYLNLLLAAMATSFMGFQLTLTYCQQVAPETIYLSLQTISIVFAAIWMHLKHNII